MSYDLGDGGLPVTPGRASARDAAEAARALEELVVSHYGPELLTRTPVVREQAGGWFAEVTARRDGVEQSLTVGLLGRGELSEEHDVESASSLAFAAVAEWVDGAVSSSG